MSTATLDAMLVRTPEVCGGKLRIDGTRVTVNQIAVLYKRGESAEEIAEHYPQATLAQIYAALAWYHSHTQEIEQELADEEVEAERLEALQRNSPPS
jgi:uncharacterized protein (DUF433 family)